jgi:hypothetical protein
MRTSYFRGLAVGVWFLAIALFGAMAAHAGTVPESITDLPAFARDKINTSISAFVKGKSRADRSANNLGWDCQTAVRLVELGVDGARERLSDIADKLQNDATRSTRSGKAIGWSWVAERTAACVPAMAGKLATSGRCEGSATVYAFQSGLGLACMARAGTLLQRPDFIQTAKEVLAYWDNLRQPEAGCVECVFFSTSDSAGDEARYIRNMNLFMAWGASEVGRATDDDHARNLAKRAMRADLVERVTGNKGYLSQLDPIWRTRPAENERIENHSASVALVLKAMHRSTGETAADEHALTVYRDWAGCDNKRCQTAGCTYWAGDAKQCQATATAAHCAFRTGDQVARAQCETYLDRVKSVGSYALWSVLAPAKP